MIRLPVLIFRVTGRSMEPFAREGDYAVSMRIFFNVKRGDVVVFRDPSDGSATIKRVTQTRSTDGGEEYFVVGDNSSRSTDSNSFGYIQRRSIIAKVLFMAKPRRESAVSSR